MMTLALSEPRVVFTPSGRSGVLGVLQRQVKESFSFRVDLGVSGDP